jgi:DNA-binding beta-propeller fold protein YncE
MSVAVTSQIRYSHTIGRLVQSGPGFNSPVDVAAAPGGRLYTVNRSNLGQAPRNYLRVNICTVGEEYIGQFTEFGRGDGQIVWPTSVAVDGDVNVYVSDEDRHDIQVFDRDGSFLRKWGTLGSEPGQFNHPSGLATDQEGNVLVVDSLNNRVQKLTPHGQPILSWGEPGDGPGQFNLPWGIAVDRHGQVYVADWRNGRVQQFDPDGAYLASFGDPDGEGRLDRPAGVGVDSLGNVYVSDYGKDCVQVYEPDGRLLTTLRGDATLSKWGIQYVAADPEMTALRQQHAETVAAWERLFDGPIGITVDDQDRIIIADSGKHRLQVYQRS